MRPIKLKGIAPGLTICCQKMSQNNLQNSLCKMKLKIMNFSHFSKTALRIISTGQFLICTHDPFVPMTYTKMQRNPQCQIVVPTYSKYPGLKPGQYIQLDLIYHSPKNKAGYTATSCGWVGRGGNARFPTFRLDGYGRTDLPTDGQSLLQSCVSATVKF